MNAQEIKHLIKTTAFFAALVELVKEAGHEIGRRELEAPAQPCDEIEVDGRKAIVVSKSLLGGGYIYILLND